MSSPEKLAQQQLDAYNKGDGEAFALCYSQDVVLMRLQTGEVFCKGIKQLRDIYFSLFASNPNLHCKLLQRIVCGEIAIDEEEVSGLPKGNTVHAIAMYEVKNDLIQRAWFVR